MQGSVDKSSSYSKIETCQGPNGRQIENNIKKYHALCTPWVAKEELWLKWEERAMKGLVQEGEAMARE